MRAASELLSPAVKPPPGPSPLRSAGPFPPGTPYLHTGCECRRLARPVRSTRVRPGTQSQRDAVTEGLCAQAGVPPSWHRSCQGRGCASEVALAAAHLPGLMEAFLETERSGYPYFCPGMGVFIAFTRCCDEHCRNTWKCCLLESIWAMHTRTPPLGSLFPAPHGPTPPNGCPGAVIRAAVAVRGRSLPRICLGSGCFSLSRVGLGRIPKRGLVGVANPPPPPAAGARGRLTDRPSSTDCAGVPKNLLGEMLGAQFRVCACLVPA